MNRLLVGIHTSILLLHSKILSRWRCPRPNTWTMTTTTTTTIVDDDDDDDTQYIWKWFVTTTVEPFPFLETTTTTTTTKVEYRYRKTTQYRHFQWEMKLQVAEFQDLIWIGTFLPEDTHPSSHHRRNKSLGDLLNSKYKSLRNLIEMRHESLVRGSLGLDDNPFRIQQQLQQDEDAASIGVSKEFMARLLPKYDDCFFTWGIWSVRISLDAGSYPQADDHLQARWRIHPTRIRWGPRKK